MYIIMFYGGLVLAGICFILSIVFFIRNNVANLLGDVTGWSARKAIKEINKKGAEDISKTEAIKPEVSRVLIRNESTSGIRKATELPITETVSTPTPKKKKGIFVRKPKEDKTTLLPQEEVYADTTNLFEPEEEMMVLAGHEVAGTDEEKREAQQSIFDEEDIATATLQDSDKVSTSLLYGEAGDATALLYDKEDMGTSVLYDNEEEGTTLLYDEGDEDTTLLYNDEGTTLLYDESTTVLSDDSDATTVLSDEGDATTTLLCDSDATTLLYGDNEDATTILTNEDETTLLAGEDDATEILLEDATTILSNDESTEILSADTTDILSDDNVTSVLTCNQKKDKEDMMIFSSKEKPMPAIFDVQDQATVVHTEDTIETKESLSQ